jgi:excisionase family DNA binding protein
MPQSRVLTPKECAKQLRCSVPLVRQMIRRGQLRAVRLNKRGFRIPVAALEELLTPRRRAS